MKRPLATTGAELIGRQCKAPKKTATITRRSRWSVEVVEARGRMVRVQGGTMAGKPWWVDMSELTSAKGWPIAKPLPLHTCPKCHGGGVVAVDLITSTPCPKCDGCGRVNEAPPEVLA